MLFHNELFFALFLGRLVEGNPVAQPQGLDLEVVNDLPPQASVTFAVGVASQVISFNEASAVASVVALASKIPLSDALDGIVSVPAATGIISKAALARRQAASSSSSVCTGGSAQPTGTGPVSTPDTPAGFHANTAYGNAANSATTPSGYINTFRNLNGSTQGAYAYLGFSAISAYDPSACAAKCNAITGCQAFDICTSSIIFVSSC